MIKVHFEKENRTIEIEEGENLREAAIRNKFSIYPHITKILNCRGRGLCTACTVQVLSGKIEPRNETEIEKLRATILARIKLIIFFIHSPLIKVY